MALAIEGQLHRLDGIVHCAAHLTQLGPLQDQSIDEWMTYLRVNLAAPFAVTRACAHLLRACGDGAVVLTAETHALQPAAYWGAFSVAQSGLPALAKIQAQEWEPHAHLRINVLLPGTVDSPQRRRTHPGEAREHRAAIDAVMPAYLYLVGPDSRGVSGGVFHAQG
jgi:NAD(P)-dependent dehydrogenase (short-subunit alcohol dehydrogenase family)